MNVFIKGTVDTSTEIGGWSFVLDYGDGETCQMGCSYEKCTPSYMTLVAAAKALTYLTDNNLQHQIIHTDSKFVFNGIEKMIQSWIQNNWNTSQNKAVKYKEIWQDIYTLSQKSGVSWSFCSETNTPMFKATLLATECSQKSQDI